LEGFVFVVLVVGAAYPGSRNPQGKEGFETRWRMLGEEGVWEEEGGEVSVLP
jgi:hypothetical protein